MELRPRDFSTAPRNRSAFTLIELLVAAAIAALVMMTAIPYVREVRKSPLVRAVNALVEACRQARLRAILKDQPMQVVFLNGGSVIGVEPVPTFRRSFVEAAPTDASVPADDGNRPETKPADEATLDDSVAFEWLLVNGRGFVANVVDEEALAVRFFPNGTCDALDAKLVGENRDAQRVTLDIMTGQVTVEAVR
ncbi:MAG TPA: prepilin-type N-terminal cleavage/methylation domain-containing protein [Verrucomicrobiota bacterium]|nr:prepilin-type N-terminal cleavage/methylation domain-containing protein [Verrucomicrobiota bacterium]